MKRGPEAGFDRRVREPRSVTFGPGSGRGLELSVGVGAGAGTGGAIGVAAGADEAAGAGGGADESEGAGVSCAKPCRADTRERRTTSKAPIRRMKRVISSFG